MLPYAIQNFANTVVRSAKQHPAMAVGLGGLGVLLLITLAKRDSEPLALPGSSGPAPSLPGGPLPKGTTKLTSYLSDAFFIRLHQLGDHFRSRGAKVTDEEILAVLYVESAGVDPASENSSGCVGLNQICATLSRDPLSGLKAVGFNGSKAEYKALPGERQLDFVQAFFDKNNRYAQIRSLGNLYLVNFSPCFLGKPDNFVMYREGSNKIVCGLDEGKAYAANAGIDTKPHKGFIEVADMAKFVTSHVGGAKWNELRARLINAQSGSAIAGMSDRDIRNAMQGLASGGWAPAVGACPYCRAAKGCLCSKTCSGGMTG